MRKLLFKLLFFVGSLVVVICLLVSYLMPPDYNHYLAAWLDKSELLKTTPSPRIILVGGSNLAFGVNSTVLSAATGLPVINTGLHAGLGLDNILNLIKPGIRAGDTVILTPEYTYYIDEYNVLLGEAPTVANLVDVYPQAYLHFGVAQWMKLPDIITALLQVRYKRTQQLRKTGLDEDGISSTLSKPPYSRNSFNAYGDNVGHYELEQRDIQNDTEYLIFNEGNPITIRLLNRFIRVVNERGGEVFLFFPYGRQTNCQFSVGALQKVYPYLVNNLPVTTVSTPLNNCVEDGYFFDTKYHLTREGVDLRSKQMAAELTQLLLFEREPALIARESFTPVDLDLQTPFQDWYHQAQAASPASLQDANLIARQLAAFAQPGAGEPTLQVLYHTGPKRVAVLLAGSPPSAARSTRVDLVREDQAWVVEWAGER